MAHSDKHWLTFPEHVPPEKDRSALRGPIKSLTCTGSAETGLLAAFSVEAAVTTCSPHISVFLSKVTHVPLLSLPPSDSCLLSLQQFSHQPPSVCVSTSTASTNNKKRQRPRLLCGHPQAADKGWSLCSSGTSWNFYFP